MICFNLLYIPVIPSAVYPLKSSKKNPWEKDTKNTSNWVSVISGTQGEKSSREYQSQQIKGQELFPKIGTDQRGKPLTQHTRCWRSGDSPCCQDWKYPCCSLVLQKGRHLGDRLSEEHLGTWVLLTLLSSERGTLIEVRHLCLTLSCQEQSLKWGGWGKVSLLPRNTYVLASRSTPA